MLTQERLKEVLKYDPDTGGFTWLYVHGYSPETEIDHIDRDKANNRMSNLRVVSHSCNMRNTKIFSTNTSGVKGVSYCNRTNRWQSFICVDDKLSYLGRHIDFIEAVFTRYAAEQCLGWEKCDNNTSAGLYLTGMGMGMVC